MIRIRKAPPLILFPQSTPPSHREELSSKVHQCSTQFFARVPSKAILLSALFSYSLSSLVTLSLFSPVLPIQKLATSPSFLTMPPLSIAFGLFFGKTMALLEEQSVFLSSGIIDKISRAALLAIFSCISSISIYSIVQLRTLSLHMINGNIALFSGLLFARYFLAAKKS